MSPVITLGAFYNMLMMAMAGAERVFGLLDMKPEVQDVPDAQPLGRRSQGNVRFEERHLRLQPRSAGAARHQFRGRPGPDGRPGRSHRRRQKQHHFPHRPFYQPQKGRVLVDDHDIRHVTGDSLHKQMGLVLQVNYLFTGTVMENIRYARPEATNEGGDRRRQGDRVV